MRALEDLSKVCCMATFLFKTEPSTYSFEDLSRDKSTVWDGVSNALALKHLRAVRKGDTIAIYHTGDEKQVVGLATADLARLPRLSVMSLTAAHLKRLLERAGVKGKG